MSLNGTPSFVIPIKLATGPQAASSGANDEGLIPPVWRKKLTIEALIQGCPAGFTPQGANPLTLPTASGFVVSVVPEVGSVRDRSQFEISASVFTGLALMGRLRCRPRLAL